MTRIVYHTEKGGTTLAVTRDEEEYSCVYSTVENKPRKVYMDDDDTRNVGLGKDEEQTDGISSKKAVEYLDEFAHIYSKIIFIITKTTPSTSQVSFCNKPASPRIAFS